MKVEPKKKEEQNPSIFLTTYGSYHKKSGELGVISYMKISLYRFKLYFSGGNFPYFWQLIKSYQKSLLIWNLFCSKSGEFGPFFSMKNSLYRSKSYIFRPKFGEILPKKKTLIGCPPPPSPKEKQKKDSRIHI